MPSNQEVFDKVVAHLMQQTKPAHDGNHNCVYRDGRTGNCCAVGCLLPPALAQSLSEQEFVRMQGGAWDDVVWAALGKYQEDGDPNPVAVEACHVLFGVDRNLLTRLQTIHDSERFYARTDDDKLDMLQELKRVAAHFGLEYR